MGLDGIESLYLKVTVADMYAGKKRRPSNIYIGSVLMFARTIVYQTASIFCFTPAIHYMIRSCLFSFLLYY